jgi:uncharacterized membrane protein YfcA
LLGVAGFAGGAINAAAGGGTLVTFPALLSVGLSPLSANVTNTVGLVTGYLGGVAGHGRRDPLPEVGDRTLVGAAAAGAAVGIGCLLSTPESVIAQKPVLAVLRRRLGSDTRPSWVLSAAFAGGVYGAYFGAALGVLVLALLSITSRATFAHANAVKTRLSFVVNVIAAAAFAILAPVAWGPAGVIAVTSTAGGFLGGTAARRIPVRVLRGVTAVLGLIAFVRLVR